MARLKILVDGRLALTTAMLAAEFGLSPQAIRMAIMRLGIEPVDEIDARTPLYPAVATRAKLRARPGRGANLRKR
ncbi:MAG TPA: hypothetical protein VFM37_01415 [Pseudonocardiaceae bacterium]|nr:hypothetical protein [Pseudonocardiaceae bacterium]